MERYGVVVTEKVTAECPTIHWLKRGTVVRIVGECEVECVAPCYPVDKAVGQMGRRKHRQFINPEDVTSIDPDQLAALRDCVPLHPLKLASACMQAWR